MSTPTLLDDRVDAMRAAVMGAVDTNVRARGRRVRRAGASIVAAATVIVIAGVGASLLQGSSVVTSASDGGAATTEAVDTDVRQIVRTGSATVVVNNPRREVSRVVGRIESLGGRVDSRNESGSGKTASAYLTVRVPSARLSQAVDQLSQSGDVVSVSLQNDDVTSTVVDLDARIRALKISIDRLEKILSQADQSADVVAAENALTQRQSELEAMTSQRDAIGEDVDLARLDIELVQDEQIDDVDPDGFFGGLTRGWNSLIAALNGAVEVAGTMLPWAAVALLGYAAVTGGRRIARQRRTARSTRS
ncbi:MAG: DUF4349 domain-containing protein [Aeromicrobium sp.]|uniref:DUF4349 domain-containing protein n=1 Tax=Aeromicrobium sp. TaxID=1871063 RepID=UPI003C368494